MKKFPIRSVGERPRFATGRQVRKRYPSEKRAEARLRHLETLVSSLRAVSYPIWLTNTDHICGIVDKLRMKEAAAHWMLRIMYHFSGQAREALLSLLEQSLDDLENTVKLAMHTEVAA